MFLTSRIKQISLIFTDIIIFYLSLIIVLFLRYKNINYLVLWEHFILFSVLFLVWIVVFYIFNLYSLHSKLQTELALDVFRVAVINIIISTVFFYFIPTANITPKTNLVLLIFISSVLVLCSRLLIYLLFKTNILKPKIIFAAASTEVNILKDIISNNPYLDYQITSTDELFTLSSIKELVNHYAPDIIVINKFTDYSPELIKDFYAYSMSGIQIVELATIYEEIMKKIPLSLTDNFWFVAHLTEGIKQKRFDNIMKRLIDIILAIFLLILTSPIVFLACLAIKLTSAGPIFYTQTRVGLNGKKFTIYKLRTMIVNAEQNGPQWADIKDTRLTSVGKFLRKARIDELPQLLNIIIGNMSFVGPRPERPEFIYKLDQEIPFYNLRHLLKPGLTGWAQINFSYGASIKDAIEKLCYDLYYIKHFSLLLDLRIILKTIKIYLNFNSGR